MTYSQDEPKRMSPELDQADRVLAIRIDKFLDLVNQELRAKEKGYYLDVFEVERSRDRQSWLFLHGRSLTQDSKHLARPALAVDLVPRRWDNQRWTWIGLGWSGWRIVKKRAAECGLLWGGNWRWADRYHYELGGER